MFTFSSLFKTKSAIKVYFFSIYFEKMAKFCTIKKCPFFSSFSIDVYILSRTKIQDTELIRKKTNFVGITFQHKVDFMHLFLEATIISCSVTCCCFPFFPFTAFLCNLGPDLAQIFILSIHQVYFFLQNEIWQETQLISIIYVRILQLWRKLVKMFKNCSFLGPYLSKNRVSMDLIYRPSQKISNTQVTKYMCKYC